jgi:adenine deaminase
LQLRRRPNSRRCGAARTFVRIHGDLARVLPRPTQLLSVARGESPADLVLRDGQIVNVFSGEIERGDIAIVDGVIAGVGHGYSGRGMIDLAGAFVAPGYIDAHVHIESSLCVPREFARAVLPRGVTAVVTDPHEIANVAGRAVSTSSARRRAACRSRSS